MDMRTLSVEDDDRYNGKSITHLPHLFLHLHLSEVVQVSSRSFR